MTFIRVVQHAALVLGACWLSAPLSAHVLDLGTIERPRDAFTNQSVASIVVAPADRPLAGEPVVIRHGNPILPGDKRTTYTFADVVPRIDGSLALGGSTMRALYREVIGIARSPEIELWLAVFIAFCMIGVQLRRTQRLLHHRPMAR